MSGRGPYLARSYSSANHSADPHLSRTRRLCTFVSPLVPSKSAHSHALRHGSILYYSRYSYSRYSYSRCSYPRKLCGLQAITPASRNHHTSSNISASRNHQTAHNNTAKFKLNIQTYSKRIPSRPFVPPAYPSSLVNVIPLCYYRRSPPGTNHLPSFSFTCIRRPSLQFSSSASRICHPPAALHSRGPILTLPVSFRMPLLMIRSHSCDSCTLSQTIFPHCLYRYRLNTNSRTLFVAHCIFGFSSSSYAPRSFRLVQLAIHSLYSYAGTVLHLHNRYSPVRPKLS